MSRKSERQSAATVRGEEILRLSSDQMLALHGCDYMSMSCAGIAHAIGVPLATVVGWIDLGRRDGYLTVKEVAAEFGVNIATVQRWIYAGELRSIKPGSKRLILIEDFQAFKAASAAIPERTRRAFAKMQPAIPFPTSATTSLTHADVAALKRIITVMGPALGLDGTEAVPSEQPTNPITVPHSIE